MKKILHVMFHSVPNNNGYSIRGNNIVSNLAEKYNVKVLTSTFQYSENSVEKIDSVTYYRLNKIFKSFELIQNIVLIFLKVLIMNRKNHFDIIHVHSPWIIAFPSILSGKILRIKTIYEVRGSWEDTDVAIGKKTEGNLKYKVIQKIEEWCMKNAEEVVVISNGLKSNLITRGVSKNKITHISNGVNSQMFNPENVNKQKTDDLKKRLNISEDDVVVGYISSLRKLEGVQNIINAAHYLKKNNKYKYIIVGDGEYKSELEKLCNELQLTDKFIFTGKVPHEEIIEYYGLIDIFVIPRIDAKVNHLVTPLKPYEALAMGKFLLVSRVSGLTEIIKENETGLSFKVDDPKDLAEKIDYISNHPELKNQLKKNARLVAEEKLDWRIVTKKYQEIYDGVN